ncbi:NAD(P)-dependent oxidoreductase [uncultured Limnohabitans sp.]|jgi:3-hydroxyisobutyrate dehydrogenase-like beta-hydroxyacid dehydrogenase|uniref:NAD(P)-dependent oxidoreductase n=1 Tax=uncultured Limnohabitans sp. TaxID=768543 RepID=UPI00262558C4|nr:NAD(P)-dependent oxidoreductase [uncultured Limnohabitans sp.]
MYQLVHSAKYRSADRSPGSTPPQNATPAVKPETAPVANDRYIGQLSHLLQKAHMTHIGMIGIGMMGHGIASNLLKHGHHLTVLEHAGNQPLDTLLAAGAHTCATPQALAAQSDVVILCVTGTPQVEAVLLGDDGVLKGLRPGTIVIDCSTAVPTSTEKVAALVIAQGGRFLDSPMTRTPKEAAEGRLNLLVGGDAALFETCKPILACFAENIVHTGPIGSGHRMKLLHNYVSLGTVTLLAEAAACAQRAGVDAHTFVEVLSKGGGFGAALDRLKPTLLSGDTSGLRFSMSNALKDLSYYNQMAIDTQADHTVAQAVKNTLEAACQEGNPNALVPELVALLAKR